MKSKKHLPLAFDYKLFEGSHVPNFDLSKNQGQTTNEVSFIFLRNTKRAMVYELVEMSNTLQTSIIKNTNKNK